MSDQKNNFKKNIKTRLSHLGTLFAILISSLALVVSVYETSLLDTQQRAMVWPYVEITKTYNAKGFSVYAQNKGTGPALIKSYFMIFKGSKTTDFDKVFDLAHPQRKIGYDLINVNSLDNGVLSVGEKKQLLFIPWTDEGRILVEKLDGLELKLKYCSVLEECWEYYTKTEEYKKY